MAVTDIVIKPFISADTVKLSDHLLESLTNAFPTTTVNRQDIISWLIDFANENRALILELSSTRPDYEALKQQFFARLSQKDTWKDIIQAGGGETILEFVGTVGALGQKSIIVASQETNLDTAALTSSIYVLMRMLGVHIRRKIPAHVDVQLNNNIGGNVSIPSLSQFLVGGISFFNRESITFNEAFNTANVRLYQGTVFVNSFLSSGGLYQRFEIGENQYNISDTDIYCFTSTDNEWKRVENGMWNYSKNDRVFFENTTPEGSVEILLGNDVYGATPPVNEVLNFIFATTDGASGNSSRQNQPVVLTTVNRIVPDRIKRNTPEEVETEITKTIALVTGETTSPVEGGDNEKDKEHYRAVGPFLFSGKKGMIRKKEHYAVGLEFPGVADILFQNQKDLQPYNRNLINVVYVTPLMKEGRLITPTEWEALVEYLEERQIWRVDWVLFQPTPVTVNIDAKIYCTLNSDIVNIEAYAKYKLNEFFALGRGSLGKSLERSDISDILKLNYHNMKVDYVELVDPDISVVLDKTGFIKPGNFNIEPFFTKRNHGNYVPTRPEDSNPLI